MKLWLIVLLVWPLMGRDLYIWPGKFIVSPGERIVVLFNGGDTLPESDDSLNMNLLRDYNLLSPRANYTIRHLHVDGRSIAGRVRIPRKGEFLLTGRLNPQTIGRETSREFAKSILFADESTDQYRHFVGFDLEIVPRKDPYALHAGDSLPVQVIWHGKPAPGLSVDAAHTAGKPAEPSVIGTTGPDGRIAIPIRETGMWRLRAIARQQNAQGGEDIDRASLTFAVR